MRGILLLIVGFCLAKRQVYTHTPYNRGDNIKVSCQTLYTNGTPNSKEWIPIYCQDPKGSKDDVELTLSYEIHQEYKCLVKVTPIVHDFLALYGQGHIPWTCRIPISKNAVLDSSQGSDSAFIPIQMSVWSKYSTLGVYIMTRLNIILHSYDGFILGASVYSLKDSYHSISQNSEMNALPLHGSIHWFVGHTFESPNPNPHENTKHRTLLGIPTASDLIYSVRPSTLIMWILISSTITFGICSLLYIGYLKPHLLHDSKVKRQ